MNRYQALLAIINQPFITTVDGHGSVLTSINHPSSDNQPPLAHRFSVATCGVTSGRVKFIAPGELWKAVEGELDLGCH